MVDTSFCGRCREDKPVCEFTKNRSTADGYSSYCNPCRKTYRVNVHYNRTNEPQICSMCNVIKPAPEFYSNTKRLNGIDSRCKTCSSNRTKNYYSRNSRNFILQLYTNARRRSLKNKVPFDMSFDEWMDIYNKQNGVCSMTGIKMTYKRNNKKCDSRTCHTNISPDQKYPGKGYTKDNLHFICWYVNQAKNDMPVDEFVDMCRLICLKNII